MRAFMVCYKFAVNGSRGLPTGESSGRHKRRRGGRSHSTSSWEVSSGSDEFSARPRANAGALSGGTDRHRLWRRVATLPARLGEAPVNATPDTGSDSNAISAAFAEELGLQVDASRNCLASFQLANGCEIESSGITSTTCAFRQGSTSKQQSRSYSMFSTSLLYLSSSVWSFYKLRRHSPNTAIGWSFLSIRHL
jgi:hypothetical protein